MKSNRALLKIAVQSGTVAKTAKIIQSADQADAFEKYKTALQSFISASPANTGLTIDQLAHSSLEVVSIDPVRQINEFEYDLLCRILNMLNLKVLPSGEIVSTLGEAPVKSPELLTSPREITPRSEATPRTEKTSSTEQLSESSGTEKLTSPRKTSIEKSSSKGSPRIRSSTDIIYQRVRASSDSIPPRKVSFGETQYLPSNPPTSSSPPTSRAPQISEASELTSPKPGRFNH